MEAPRRVLRQPPEHDWTVEQVAAGGMLPLECVGLDLPLTSVYESVDLSQQA